MCACVGSAELAGVLRVTPSPWGWGHPAAGGLTVRKSFLMLPKAKCDSAGLDVNISREARGQSISC